jgi:ADP-heptose:LPS heptosyltransferase
MLVPDADDDVMRLAALVGALGDQIANDSLALHLALARSVPFRVFFSPTGAAERWQPSPAK